MLRAELKFVNAGNFEKTAELIVSNAAASATHSLSLAVFLAHTRHAMQGKRRVKWSKNTREISIRQIINKRHLYAEFARKVGYSRSGLILCSG